MARPLPISPSPSACRIFPKDQHPTSHSRACTTHYRDPTREVKCLWRSHLGCLPLPGFKIDEVEPPCYCGTAPVSPSPQTCTLCFCQGRQRGLEPVSLALSNFDNSSNDLKSRPREDTRRPIQYFIMDTDKTQQVENASEFKNAASSDSHHEAIGRLLPQRNNP